MTGPAPLTVAVTGASGLIGRAAVAALAARGHRVIALRRDGMRGEGVAEVLAADLLAPGGAEAAGREAAGRGASHLLHLAWAGGRARMRSAENLDWPGASLALLRGFAAGGGVRAVGTGSCAEYDWSGPETRGGAFAETAPLRPASLYGQAKAATGTLWCAGAPCLGLSAAWARPFFVYGPGEGPGRLLSDLALGLRAGRPVPCTDGRQVRDFLHAADLGTALALLLESGEGGAVNLGSGEGVAVGALTRLAAELLGRPGLVQAGAIPRAPDDPPHLVADIARLAALGFRPRFGLRAGLADALGLTEGAGVGA